MENIVIFSGAGMSAESGLSTFRDGNGLWDKYPIEEVATPEAWDKDKEKVLHFYSMRMENCLKANPNLAHQIIFEFEEKYNVKIYKLASFEITDLKLINYIASKKKPIIISTGMSTIKEIKSAINVIKKFSQRILIILCLTFLILNFVHE